MAGHGDGSPDVGFESIDDLDDVEGFSETRKQELASAVEIGGSSEEKS